MTNGRPFNARASALFVMAIALAIMLWSGFFSSRIESRVHTEWDWANGKRTLKICLENSDKCPPNLADSLQKAINNWNAKLVSWKLIYTEDCDEADVTVRCGGITSLGKIRARPDRNGKVSSAEIRVGAAQSVQWGYCDDKHEVVPVLEHELGHAMRLRHGNRNDVMWKGSRDETRGHGNPISPNDSTEAATSDGNQDADVDTDGPGTERGSDYNGVITPSAGTDPFDFADAIDVELEAYRPDALNVISWLVTGENELSWSCHALPQADDTEAFKIYITYPESIAVRQGYIEVVDPGWDMAWRPEAIAPPDTFINWPDTLVTLYDTLSTHPAGREAVDFWWMIDDEIMIMGDTVLTTWLDPGQHFAVLHAEDHAGYTDTDTMYIFMEGYTGVDAIPPAGYYLDRTYPNPFNPTATIQFGIAERARVTIRIYDTAGRLVKTLCDRVMEPDIKHSLTWNGMNDGGRPVASGVYYCKMAAGGFAATRKLVLLR